jgi:hypothetical protein
VISGLEVNECNGDVMPTTITNVSGAFVFGSLARTPSHILKSRKPLSRIQEELCDIGP